ncbi:MAG: HTTM domain-containing protein [Deltaproteobacteria bacterium]|nr:HTTM domain-containing protein [Deltaproteobacteria bacterium]
MRLPLGDLRAPALTLALLRSGVAAIALASPEASVARAVSARDPSLRLCVDGARWLGTTVPFSPRAVDLVELALRASGLLTLLGLWTRWSVVALLLSFGYVSAAVQCEGTAFHDMHLLWMLCLLAVSPCGEALSLDRWARGGSVLGDGPERASGEAVALARALLAMVYFFPGLWKLWTSGPAWVLGDNLRNQLWYKWFEHGHVPAWRIDRAPWLCSLGALSVLALELGFPALVLTARGRVPAMLGGITFHALSAVFLAIHFPSLLVCYVVLLDGEALRQRGLRYLSRAGAREGDGGGRARARGLWWVRGVGGALCVAVAVQGARGRMQAWPFACYPTFEYIAPDTVEDLAAEVALEGGGVLWLRAPRARPQGAWGLTWRLLGRYGGGVDLAALGSWARATAARQGHARALASARSVRYWAERWSADPDRAGEGPLERRPVGE